MNKAVFETKLFRIMKQNQDNEKRRRTKSGLIDSSRLAKYKTSNRVFKKRNQEKLGKNYFISILMDASGSMSTSYMGKSRFELCKEAVIKLCDSLDKIEGMHFEVVGFNALQIKYKDYNESYNSEHIQEMYSTHYQHNRNGTGEIKFGFYLDKKGDCNSATLDYIEKMRTKNECERYRSSQYASAGENFDPIAVFNSFERIKERNGRKILVVFSDGIPTLDYDFRSFIEEGKTLTGSKILRDLYISNKFESRNILKKIVKKNKPKDIDILGIGIQSTAVEKFYPNSIVVNDLNELYSKTIKALSKLFKKD